MPERFENPEVIKPEDETVADAKSRKRIDRIAEKAAEEAAHVERRYDQDHPIISK